MPDDLKRTDSKRNDLKPDHLKREGEDRAATSRRRFLTGAALAAGGVVALSGTARAQDPSPSSSPSPEPTPTDPVPLPGSPARRFATDVGDGTSRSIDVEHGLGTKDVLVQIYQNADGQEIECDVARTSPTRVTLSFTIAPAPASLRVVVVG